MMATGPVTVAAGVISGAASGFVPALALLCLAAALTALSVPVARDAWAAYRLTRQRAFVPFELPGPPAGRVAEC